MGRKKKDNHVLFVLDYLFVDERRPQKFSNYVIQITPLEKAWFFENLYESYMNSLKKENPERHDFIRKFETDLATKKGMQTVLFLFKRIIPTIEDNDDEPFDLLRAAISDIEESEGANFEKLHVFMTISTLRWAYLEKSISGFKTSHRGRDSHSWDKTNPSEFELLSPLFFQMNISNCDFSAEETNGNKYYSQVLDKLVQEDKILRSRLVEIKKNLDENEKKSDIKKEKEKKRISDALELLNTYSFNKTDEVYQKVIKALLQIETLKIHYKDKYRRFREHCKNNRLWFPDPVGRYFCLADIKETFWKKMPRWDVKDFIMEKEIDQFKLAELFLRESKNLNKPSDPKKTPPLLTIPNYPDIP